MLTLITGVPGSGKTLYAIAKLLLPMLGETVTVTDKDTGVSTVYPRRIFTNINGLQIDHELVEPGPVWVARIENKQLIWEQADGNLFGWHNWHQWAKPGDILVPDEFQRIWPQRPNGSPVPPDLSAMDTHRHMGVDFVFITQKFSFDRHIDGLVGRHLHVRRIGNTYSTIVYEWDMCSRTLQFSKCFHKGHWRFPKKVFKLYHSADAHTKQPRKIPTLIYVVIAAIALAAYQVPNAWSRIAGKTGQVEQLTKADQAKKKPAAPVQTPAPGAPGSSAAPGGSQNFTSIAPAAAARPSISGCAMLRDACRCWDTVGELIDMPAPICTARFSSPAPLAQFASATNKHAAPQLANTAGPGENQVIRTVSGPDPLLPAGKTGGP